MLFAIIILSNFSFLTCHYSFSISRSFSSRISVKLLAVGTNDAWFMNFSFHSLKRTTQPFSTALESLPKRIGPLTDDESQIERRKCLGCDDWIAIGHDQHRNADTNPRCVRRNEGHGDKRVVNVGPRGRAWVIADDYRRDYEAMIAGGELGFLAPLLASEVPQSA